MTVAVKICGIRTEHAYRAALEEGADYIGFVFFERSPRAVYAAQVASLVALRPAGHALRHVGLFVNPTDQAIENALPYLDILQLTDVTPQRAEAVRARFGLPVWRAASVASSVDLPADNAVDALLLDAAHGVLPGGNGTAFDWRILHDWQAPGFWLLAGGLTPDNVQSAIRETGAPAVDVSSGVERVRGEKDDDLIRQFIRQARSA